ncbi:MAG: class IV adenylate cyclase [Candidatus Aenigmarchaeota archaeon]|nr:class IV adenylate cyclase [Candidatus Aenigmarchaeota archaeon]
MIETEIKIKVDDFKNIQKKLNSFGAKKISSVFEKNIVFDTEKKELKKKDCFLRVREDKKATLCFKGPREKTNTKKREEIEFEILDAKKAEQFLMRLGFDKKLRYEKNRESWDFKKTEIVLDELPFGKFIEIEGNEKDINAAAKILGYNKKEFITKTYFELAEEAGIKKDIIFGDDTNG